MNKTPKTNKHYTPKYGSNQVSDATHRCADPWHYTFADGRPYDDGVPETGDMCPACGAVMHSGTAVAATYYAELISRKATKRCLAATGGKFVCDCKASNKALASGVYLCEKHYYNR